MSACPTLSDTSYDKPRIKKTTGIPKTFLKSIAPEERATQSGVMLNEEGNMVVAVLNDAEWRKKAEQANKEVPIGLRCGLCLDLLVEAVRTACCAAKPYCEECVRDAETCPECKSESFKPLKPDPKTREAVRRFTVGEEAPPVSTPAFSHRHRDYNEDRGQRGNHYHYHQQQQPPYYQYNRHDYSRSARNYNDSGYSQQQQQPYDDPYRYYYGRASPY